jgi:hypothetical protein
VSIGAHCSVVCGWWGSFTCSAHSWVGAIDHGWVVCGLSFVGAVVPCYVLCDHC